MFSNPRKVDHNTRIMELSVIYPTIKGKKLEELPQQQVFRIHERLYKKQCNEKYMPFYNG